MKIIVHDSIKEAHTPEEYYRAVKLNELVPGTVMNVTDRSTIVFTPDNIPATNLLGAFGGGTGYTLVLFDSDDI